MVSIDVLIWCEEKTVLLNYRDTVKYQKEISQNLNCGAVLQESYLVSHVEST